jgi:low density lipoprotein-related protein 2
MPMSIFVFKYNLYFIDGIQNTIYKISKFSSFAQTTVRSNINGLYQLKVYSTDTQKSIVNHPCARQNGDCSHFCYAVPSLDPQYQISRHCGCPYGFKLDTNLLTCMTDPEETAETSRCDAPYYFKCANNRCIRLELNQKSQSKESQLILIFVFHI